jgi:hypothetical protein
MSGVQRGKGSGATSRPREREIMQFKGEISTWIVGSACEFEFEVEPHEVEGMTDQEREAYIEASGREAAFQYIEWHFDQVDADTTAGES